MATTSKHLYKKIESDISVYGSNKSFGGSAIIFLHFGDASQTIQLELFEDFDTIEKAENALIRSVECWIDENTKKSS